MSSRESIMTALETLLQGVAGVVTVSRRNRAPETIGPSNSPAVFVLEDSEQYEVRSVALSPIRHLLVSIIVYNDIGSSNADLIPATAINNILDALDAALQPTNPSNIFTLGGLVDSVIVDGEVKKAPGDKTGKSVAIVPLRITMP